MLRRSVAASFALALLLAASPLHAEDDGGHPSEPAGLTFQQVNAHGVEEWLRTKDGATVIRVPAGEFLRRPYEGWEAEEDPRPVEVAAFFVDRTEVTNAQFALFLNQLDEEAELRQLMRDDVPGITRGDDGWSATKGMETHPVTAATGYGAAAYAEWVGGRLPEPAEWEKAATGTDGRLFPWGDQMPDRTYANFGGEEGGGVVAVGSFPRNVSPYGCVDMAGNAYERVWMRERGRADAPVMIKGGSWVSLNGLNLRALDLCVQPMQVADRSVGFRCVMDDPTGPTGEPKLVRPAEALVFARTLDDAVKQARELRRPILIALFHETCGQSDRVRAQLFRDPEFVAYCNRNVVVLAGHNKSHAEHLAVGADDKDAPTSDYGGLTWRELGANYAAAMRVVGGFRVSPGMFVLHPDRLEGDEDAILVPELRLPKWGGGTKRYVTELEAARKTIAGE